MPIPLVRDRVLLELVDGHAAGDDALVVAVPVTDGVGDGARYGCDDDAGPAVAIVRGLHGDETCRSLLLHRRLSGGSFAAGSEDRSKGGKRERADDVPRRCLTGLMLLSQRFETGAHSSSSAWFRDQIRLSRPGQESFLPGPTMHSGEWPSVCQETRCEPDAAGCRCWCRRRCARFGRSLPARRSLRRSAASAATGRRSAARTASPPARASRSPRWCRRARFLPRTTRSSRLQTAYTGSDGTRYPPGTAIPIRADFNALDNPFYASDVSGALKDSPAAGLHFIMFNPSSDGFERNRLARDGVFPDGETGIAQHSRLQGFNSILRTTHRQDILVPPHRGFPLAEL